ncbi:uncharacterized protein F4822DRAFT_427730 [Hypoxylon trugodes]|uniref:uncharacterized protein n=1 Tax=Hypoxylon trugodes TaxID=326681 RepID=UPI002195FC6B|nr:uncharacterized protein F4822DRAFT_427730 [Hypoxylon trugodes]KAI1389376.1 hypothetical protein F4822DRAFT_427730 [Hypoxylon trugodes]
METSSRRKACDTCFKRKIKCDMLKPACSNCLLYKVPCSTTVIRRRTAPAPQKEIAKSTSPANSGDNLEARLARIEAKLDRLGDSSPSATTTEQHLCGFANQDAWPLSNVSPLEQSDEQALERNDDQGLPPVTEILPVVEDYFRGFNAAMPLFNQHQFMQMLYDFYPGQEQTKKSRAVWAAINVVLAIGYRVRRVEGDDILARFNEMKIKKCIDNAQRELDELVTREEDTLGIQVLLGLVLLFETSTDQKPASVIIGTAVRLAHRLQLHVKSSLSNLPIDEARHRSNVFWLCYCLDKDVSFRAKIPSIQNDDDIDLPLPGADFGDDGHFLQSIDGHSQLNYFRARVQLAYLEGKVYDYLLSNRSTKISPRTRQERVSHLSTLLDQWLQAIPAPLQFENITRTLEKAPLTHMIILYQAYLLCSTTINGLYSLESPWIKSINGYSSAVLFNIDTQAHICTRHQQPLVPHYWAACVTASRACLKLLDSAHDGCNMWLSGCAYFSSFVVLLANIVYFPLHEFVEFDQKLTANTMDHMTKLLELTGSEAFKKLHVIVVGLEQAATYAVKRAKKIVDDYEPEPEPESEANLALDHDALHSLSQHSVFSDHFSESFVPQLDTNYASGSTWPQASPFGTSGMDLGGFDFNDEMSVPMFMRDIP